MTKKTTKNTSQNKSFEELTKLKKEYAQIRLNIKTNKEKNTNAHKALKKKIAQLLTHLK